MYLFLLFGAIDEQSVITFEDGIKMIKKSLLFKICRKNIIFTYFLFLIELALVSAVVATFYAASIKIFNIRTMVGICLILFFMYVSLNSIIYCFFDEYNYLNRTRPDILDAETIERLENVNGTEETNISQQISVSTSL